MTNLEPCLAGCDAALAEAETLLAMLSAQGAEQAVIAPVQQSIARLRREVDRLRGMKVAPARRETDPFWMQLRNDQAPWPHADEA